MKTYIPNKPICPWCGIANAEQKLGRTPCNKYK